MTYHRGQTPQIVEDAFDQLPVLITGGLGFIGSNLARRLVALGAKVTLVDSMIPEYGGNFFNIHDIADAVTVNICDVRDPYAMAYLVKGQRCLFNLAGQTSHIDSMSDPKADLDINAGAQLSILEACRRHNREVKIVFASTRQVYGKPNYLPTDELHPVAPVDVNGINKLAGEMYHLLYYRVHGIRACALRLTNVYGPGMRVKDARQTFLGVWIRSVVDRDPILVFGDGTQLRDFNYVDDCVEALLLAAMSPKADGQIYNLGGNEAVSLADLARRLERLAPGTEARLVPFPPDRKAIDIGDYHGDYRRICGDLGWSPQVTLEIGLRLTIDFYARHHAHYWGEGS
jgi:UDP-glucose 4-epimerase